MLLTFKLFPVISNEALSSAPTPSTNVKANTVRSSLTTVKSPTTVPTGLFSSIVNFDKVKTVGNLSSSTVMAKACSNTSPRLLTACTRIL